MVDQLDIFNFINELGGTAKLIELKENFYQIPDLEKVLLAYSSLFWISKITENYWEVRTKVDVELCVSYLQGSCNGDCGCLHLCKSFLLSGENICKQPCKNGFSHDIKDAHNKTVLYGYNLDHNGINVLRASFPRLCASFQKSGKCEKHFCGYVHLCKFFLQGKCKNKCQFAARTGLSQQHVHGLLLPHNRNVFSSFDLDDEKPEVLVGNILFHSEFEDYNQSETLGKTWEANCSSKLFERKVSTKRNTQRPLICGFYLNGKCHKGNECKRLHICKEFLINSNRCSSIICQYGFSHDPFDQNNSKITKSKWTETDASKIIHFLRESFPRLCRNYEKGHCVGEYCQKLHICDNSLYKICQTNCCPLSHDITDEHNSNIFRRYNLGFLLKLPKTYVLPNILVSKRSRIPTNILSKSCQSVSRTSLSKSFPSISDTGATSCKDGQLDWLKQTALCLDFLNDNCTLNEKCVLMHNPYKTPYLWQYKSSKETSWTSYDKKSNENIEKAFSDPSQTRSRHTATKLEVWFQKLPSVYDLHFTNGIDDMLYRRLSTGSSVADDSNTKVGVTNWKWYWEKSKDVWEEYKIGTNSNDIETSFLNPNQDEHVFSMSEFIYTLSFNEMRQSKVGTGNHTKRNVRRRPKFQPTKDSKLKKHPVTLYPRHWPSNIAEGSKIGVSNAVFDELKASFEKSIRKPVRIINIEEICNHKFLDRFERKKKEMGAKREAAEMLLYHGTSQEVVDAICRQNFNFRLCGKHVTAYGKGVYFSKKASYSHQYSSPDPNGHCYMLMAQVLVGRYTEGKSFYIHPPTLTTGASEFYDSCVDNVSSPSLYIVFEIDQCYPKYLIEYEVNENSVMADERVVEQSSSIRSQSGNQESLSSDNTGGVGALRAYFESLKKP